MIKQILVLLVLNYMLFAQAPNEILKLSWGKASSEIGLREAPDARYAAQSFRVSGDTISVLDGQNGLLKRFVKNQFLQASPVSPLTRDFITTATGDNWLISDRLIQRQSLSKKSTRTLIGQGKIIQRLLEFPESTPLIHFSDGSNQPLEQAATANASENAINLIKKDNASGIVNLNLKGQAYSFEISFPDADLASLSFAGMDANKRLFIHTEQFLSQVPLSVERQVRVYNLQGQLLAVFKIPLNHFALIFRDLYVSPQGRLYQMLEEPQGIRILKWPLPPSDPQFPIQLDAPLYHFKLPDNTIYPEEEKNSVPKTSALPIVTPETALAIADTYDKLNWTCAAVNLTNGTITDASGNHVHTPDWLYAGSVRRVPYKWGGFNTISGFLNGISAGKFAGDQATDSVSPEAVGVDCSGFVSRCWTLPSHYSTRMMDDAITLAYDSWEQTLPGDVCHKPGHVRLIVGHQADGSIDMVESAGFNWRVSYTNYSYSQITAYTPRYYINMQGTPGNIPQPTLQAITSHDQCNLQWTVSQLPTLAGFNIKQSKDGMLFDEEDFVPVDSVQYMQSLTDTQARYYQVTSLSKADQSESLASDTYGIYRNDLRGKILIVDGFDRTSATTGSWGHDYHSFAAIHGRALQALQLPFETVANEALLDSLVHLSDYQAVIWICGDESTADETFSTAEQALVADYLTNGGQLFVSGSEIGWDLDRKGSTQDKYFYHNFLKAAYVEDNALSYSVQGAGNSEFDSLDLRYDDGSHGVYAEDYPDAIAGFGGGAIALKYANGKNAAVYYEGSFGSGTDTGRVFYMAFPFETLYREQDRIALLSKITEFFKIDTFKPEPIPAIITHLELQGNYPNPFNGQTHIRFYMPAAGRLKISVFNMRGRLVFQKSFASFPQGAQEIPISAQTWASGVYPYQLSAQTEFGTQKASAKFVLLK